MGAKSGKVGKGSKGKHWPESVSSLGEGLQEADILVERGQTNCKPKKFVGRMKALAKKALCMQCPATKVRLSNH
jgi:hypothetical protein